MTVLIALLTSILTTFLIGRLYLNLQYHKSNAGFRQNEISKATHELIKQYNDNGVIGEEYHKKYKFALSIVLERLILSYGVEKQDKSSELYPVFHGEHESAWDFYAEYIRPVMIDLNNNAFVGWINTVPNVKRLKVLWDICFALEKIIALTEFLNTQNFGHQLITIDHGSKQIKINVDINSIPELIELKKHYNIINKLWNNWLSFL
jgi:hypothetical protein